MKKTMMIVCVAAASLALAAGIVEETKSRPVLAGSAQVAPLGDVTQKVTSLGTLIGNPIVPTLLLSSGQQRLVEKYGRLRADAPVTWLAYVQTPAWDVAATNLDQVAVEDMFETVLVYPGTDGPANLLLKHPGATKDADGTIHLLPGKDNPDDTYVKYTPDARYCAFAASPELAARALVDFAALSARREDAAGDGKLLRVEIAERGVTALATLYAAVADGQQTATNGLSGIAVGLQGPSRRNTQAMLETVGSCTFALDVDASGLTLEGALIPKPGRRTPFASRFVLPTGVLDRMPAAAPLFFFGGDRFGVQSADEGTFRADMAELGEGVAAFLSQAANASGDARYRPFLKDVGTVLSQAIRNVPFPADTDWTGTWLAFDGTGYPYCEKVRQSAKVDAERALVDRLLEGLAGAFDKQWPGKGLLAKRADAVTFDIEALVDLCGAEAGVKPGDEDAKELANAKKTIKTILGSGKLVWTSTYEGNMFAERCAALGVKSAAVGTPPTGEARVAAALPETAARRPAAVFGLELYALARNAVLPVLAKVAAKKDARQYKAMIAAMPPPEANSAIAGAGWTDANGSLRALLRVTAGEIRNLGAAFNAFTAASLVGADND